MQYGIYSVRDVLNGYGPIMCDYNDKTAIRNFCAAFSAGLRSSARDYDLFRIGSFDTETGMIVPEPSAVLIYRGIDCLQIEVGNDG